VEQVDNTIKTVRKIASQLRPPTLDEFGLSAALEWQSKEFTGRTGIQCFFNSNDPGTLLKKITATNLFRIYQESLTNVARHSKATTVHASFMLTGNKITLSIEDNGEGFDTEEIKTKNRLGLLGMKERIIIMEGELFIESAPGKGTCLTIQVPFHPIL
jgi:signal transduction histidine kinase